LRRNSADSVESLGHSIGRFRRASFVTLAATMTLVLGLIFVVVTTLTIGIWLTDPGYVETNPVVDLGFFALGTLIIGSGFAVQLRTPTRHLAGLQQAIVGSLALALAGFLGDRVEPFAGGLVILLAALVLAALHPARGDFFKRGPGVNPPLAGLVIVAAVPVFRYADSMLAQARQAGPSCFMGQCAAGDRFVEMAALAVAVALVGWVALWRTAGWRLSAQTAGVAAIVVGLASIAWPWVPGASGTLWGLVIVAWGGAVVLSARRGP
jgi:hypothetical protein